MYITKEEMDRRLQKTEVLIKTKERKTRDGININGVSESRLTPQDRILIGALNEIDTQKNIAEALGVSQTTVSNVSRGLIAPAAGVNKELREGVNNKIEEITKDKVEQSKKIEDQLLTNLAAALGHVANNMDQTKAPEASKIALDMSRILNNVNGSKEEKGNRTAIIINVPTMKEEKHYQTITV